MPTYSTQRTALPETLPEETAGKQDSENQGHLERQHMNWSVVSSLRLHGEPRLKEKAVCNGSMLRQRRYNLPA